MPRLSKVMTWRCGGEAVHDARVPVVQDRGEVVQEDQRGAAARTELSVGERRAADVEGAASACPSTSRRSRPAPDQGREVELDLRVQRALVVAEAGLDLAAELVDDRLGLPGLDGVERGGGDGGRRDLVDVERGREVGVDEADVDADDVRALAA